MGGQNRDDILRAVATLKPLGSSYSVIQVGNRPYVRSVPKELSTDQSAVLEAAQILGYVGVSMLMLNLRWTRARAQTALEDLLAGGMLWVDRQARPEWEYWSPGFFMTTAAVAAAGNEDFAAGAAAAAGDGAAVAGGG